MYVRLTPMRKFLRKAALRIFSTLPGLLLSILIVMGGLYAYIYLGLPDVTALRDMPMQVPLRIYTRDKKLIAIYGEKRRRPVTLDQVPKTLVQAILATEDKRYFQHHGVDLVGLARAAKSLILTGKKAQGASTITMQVARNFFLTPKKTFKRKVNEILLAIKINRELSKERILELYLNKIYLGQRAYGVGAAAYVYYGKPLNELSLPQLAMIAGLPQAPSRSNPITNPEAALKRRNHVLSRMLKAGYIDSTTYEEAIHAPLTARYHGTKIDIEAPYIAEMIRQVMIEEFGKTTYTKGFKVYTTLDSRLQQTANKSLQKGLLAYDRRHGYRGPIKNLGLPTEENILNWETQLKGIPVINDIKPAIVVALRAHAATALLPSGKLITIPWQGLSWARYRANKTYWGPHPHVASDVVKVGDIIRVIQTAWKKWRLTQLPEVQGTFVTLNPKNGAILALTGGFSFKLSHFNRIIQAKRQPGSTFKPFIYSAALAKGYTLASVIDDSPVVMHGYGAANLWRPHNYNKRFAGPTRLRVALMHSRNLVSIRLLREIGIPYALDYLQRFGFKKDKLPNTLSLALGSGAVTPLQLATGYSVLANGGYRVSPYFIDHITQNGKLFYRAKPMTACDHCTYDSKKPMAIRTISKDNVFLITRTLQGVIKHGTARKALQLKRSDLAGKTGTTNDQMDAWFIGYNSDFVSAVWVGFDQPQSLHEYSSKVALPIWIDFMKEALKGTTSHPLAQPENITTARIDPKTGLLAYPGQRHTLFEIFRQEYMPTQTTSRKSNSENIAHENNAIVDIF